jgi:hypothetical protein
MFCKIQETAENDTVCFRFRFKSQTYTPTIKGTSKSDQSMKGCKNCIAIRVIASYVNLTLKLMLWLFHET